MDNIGRPAGGGIVVDDSAPSPSNCCSPSMIGLTPGSEKTPSLELCKSLIMLRDFNISGKINLIDVPALINTLHFWRVRSFIFCFISFLLLLTFNY